MKRWMVAMLTATMIFSLTACGGGTKEDSSTAESSSDTQAEATEEAEDPDEVEDTEEEPTEEAAPATDTISIDDIEWNVDEGIVDGDRYVVLDYTNNSPYTIKEFELSFTQKSDVTDEELNAYFTDVQAIGDFTEEDMAELKEKPIGASVDSSQMTKPGESVSGVQCVYYDGFYYLKNINHFNLMEPDIATIVYINDDNKIMTTYYDFKSKKYSVDDETEEAVQWSDSDLASKVPKIEAGSVEISLDFDDIFSFDANGLTIEDYNDYVAECKEKGFVNDPSETDTFYSADDSEGYSITVTFDDTGELSCILNTPDEE